LIALYKQLDASADSSPTAYLAFPTRVLAAAVLCLSVALGCTLTANSAAVRVAPITGVTTAWKVELLSIHAMDRIPHTEFANSWTFYRGNFARFYVIGLKLTNTGTHSADPYHDLNLVIQPKKPGGSAYAELNRTQWPQERLMKVAAQQFGGMLPWTATAPGATTNYCFVYAAVREQSHFGLVNFDPKKGYIYLFETGV